MRWFQWNVEITLRMLWCSPLFYPVERFQQIVSSAFIHHELLSKYLFRVSHHEVIHLLYDRVLPKLHINTRISKSNGSSQ